MKSYSYLILYAEPSSTSVFNFTGVYISFDPSKTKDDMTNYIDSNAYILS